VPVPATWQKVRTRTAYKGFVTINRDTYEEPDGAVTDWDVIAGRDSAATLAFTPAASHVVLFEQFRVGPGKALLELPGGIPQQQRATRGCSPSGITGRNRLSLRISLLRRLGVVGCELAET
jgi:hypothetical protein